MTVPALHPDMPYYCSPCKRYFSVKTGTVMERSKISYRKWAIATYLVATHPKGISSVQLGRDRGTGQNTASYLPHRLRDTWDTLTGPDLLSGPVEAGEMYFGGREKNKHADKKTRRWWLWASKTVRPEGSGPCRSPRPPLPAWLDT